MSESRQFIAYGHGFQKQGIVAVAHKAGQFLIVKESVGVHEVLGAGQKEG
jgi:hypothetical protein